MNKQFHRFVAIDGAIGVGKSTLARLFGNSTGARLILEPYDANPFLEDFYQDPASNAFKTQLFFLLSRFKQLSELPPPDLFHNGIVCDYTFQKDRLFATVNLDNDELKLYDEVASVLERRIRKPDLVVFLQASTDVLMERIRKRARSFERSISLNYLEKLNEVYNDFFFHYNETPLLVVNISEIDFVNCLEHLKDLIKQIQTIHSGTYYYVPRGT